MCLLCANILPTGICIAQKARRQRYSIYFVCTTKTKTNTNKRKQQQKQTKNQRNKVVYFFLSFLLQILFINRCVRHKSESCHSRDMVGEPLLFFFSSLLAVVVVRLLVTIAAHCRERLRHTHTTRCECRPRLGWQRERERAMAASVSSIFFTFDVVNAACSSPHLLLCSPYFVSSAKLIAKSIFYLATFERGIPGILVSRLHLQLALLAHCIWVARCLEVWALLLLSSPLLCSVLYYLFLHRVRPSFGWLSFGFCLFDCVINHMS